ncbi:MAG: hypothetical protein ACUVWR_16230 [Anaerolineae bacterium]
MRESLYTPTPTATPTSTPSPTAPTGVLQSSLLELSDLPAGFRVADADELLPCEGPCEDMAMAAFERSLLEAKSGPVIVLHQILRVPDHVAALELLEQVKEEGSLEAPGVRFTEVPAGRSPDTVAYSIEDEDAGQVGYVFMSCGGRFLSILWVIGWGDAEMAEVSFTLAEVALDRLPLEPANGQYKTQPDGLLRGLA